VEAIFIILGLILLGPAVLAIWSLVVTNRLEREVKALTSKVELLTYQVETGGAQTETTPEAPLHEEVPAAAEEVPPEPSMEADDDADAATADAELSDEVEVEPVHAAAMAAAAPQRTGFEQKLTASWLVWLGGVAIALAGVFLVKYASDQGLLGPATRTSLGFVLGLALTCGGEWVRRNPKHGLAKIAPGSYVPQAVTAAGLFMAFASVFAAYGLYELLAPLVAFAALAAIALAAFALSLLQGPFVALLGLIGGLATPALVSTDAPAALGLFSYVAMIVGACLAVVRYQRWWWLAFAAIGGGAVWAFLWLTIEHTPRDVFVTGVYLIVLAAMSLLFWWRYELPERGVNWIAEIRGATMPELAGWVGAIAVAVLMPGLVQFSDQSFASLTFVAVLCGLYGWFARRVQSMDGLVVIAGIVVLFVITVWQLPTTGQQFDDFPLPGGWRFLGPVLDNDLVPFASTAFIFGALFAVGGFFSLWQAKRPEVWAGISAAVPIGLLVLSYLRIQDRVPDVNWSVLALIIAGIATSAARALVAHRDNPRMANAFALYAAAAVAGLSFAATMMFDRAVLTVALSIQLPALAWIAHKAGTPLLRWIAGIVAGVVLARLALNWNVLDYPLGRDIGSNWILYGYGIPAVMFYWAARQFRELRDDHVVTLLEGGTMLFATLLVSLEIRTLVEGKLAAERYSLFEQSLQTISWLIIALSRMWSHAVTPRFTKLWGARILICLSLAQIVFLQLLVSNPIMTGDPVGVYPVVNVLLSAYALPGILLLASVWWLEAIGFAIFKRPIQLLSFLLIFVYITLEVQRGFQGSVLSGDPQSDAEFYAYSLAWLGFALALLALGIYRGAPMLRYASLGVLLIAVLKVFLFDMADLTGLLRVASFLGLGLCLVGIGYVYQRFVFPHAEAPDDQPAEPSEPDAQPT